MRVRLVALSIGVIVGLAILPASAQDFTFDRQRPFAVADRDVSVREITYAGPSGEATEATLVAPVAPGTSSGRAVRPLVRAHHTPRRTARNTSPMRWRWPGTASSPCSSTRRGPSRPGFRTREPGNDVAFSADQVKRIQRAVDVLASLDRVDPGRLGLVGHDFGAMYGAVVAGLDRRITTFAFVAGTAKFADWFLLGRRLDADARTRVYDELAPYDPVGHLPKVSAGAVLLQFATKDPYVTAEAAKALIDAVKAPKESKFYDCGHDMNRRGDGRPRGMAGPVARRSTTTERPGVRRAFTGGQESKRSRGLLPERIRDNLDLLVF